MNGSLKLVAPLVATLAIAACNAGGSSNMPTTAGTSQSGSTTPARAQTFTDLYNFTGSSGGGYPTAGVVRDAKGDLYGTAFEGGSSGYGVVFKVDASGTETVLHSFTGGTTDGEYPYASLLMDKNGNLYGTAAGGGSSGYGVVFKVDTSGNETLLHSFAGGTTDGCYTHNGLIEDRSGNLYGLTDSCGSSDNGTIFKLNEKGTETVLHSFAGGAKDGAYPFYTTLLMDLSGALYGVTERGGSAGYGVVYKLSEKGKLTLLHSFAGGTTDGCDAVGTPVMDKNGNVYGITEHCGSAGYGVVYNLSRKDKLTLLHSFTGGAKDGAYPFSGVILDAKGNLYGEAVQGGDGPSSNGVVYKLSKKRTLTLLHSFVGSDGDYPGGGLLRDPNGDLYGTAEQGGSAGYGTVWSLIP